MGIGLRARCESSRRKPHHPRDAYSLTRDRKLQCKYTTKQGTEYGYRWVQELFEGFTGKDFAPAIVSETAVEYYKERFAVKGFDGSPWIPGRPKKSGSLLVQSGNLMNSIRPAYVGPDKVVISAGNAQVPYAQVHNEGFEGDVAIQSYVRSTKGKANKKKADAGDAPGTVKAHTRHMNIPKRQFMGYSRDMADRIKKRLDEAIDGIL